MILPRWKSFFGEHKPSCVLNEEFPVLFTLLDCVWDIREGTLISVISNHSINWLPFDCLWSFHQLDFKDLFQKLGTVVIFIQYVDYHTNQCRLGWTAIIRNSDLFKKKTDLMAERLRNYCQSKQEGGIKRIKLNLNFDISSTWTVHPKKSCSSGCFKPIWSHLFSETQN